MSKEGLNYLMDKIMEVSKNLPPEFNAQAVPEYRAYEKVKWFPNISIDEAKKLLEEEYYWQKEENRDRYPGCKWF